MKRMNRKYFNELMLFIAIFSLVAGGALAQDYPNKPIRMIVPVAPGGATDTSARIVAEKLSQILGQQVVIENKPGAGMRIGTEIVARAAPDGYTILGTSSTHTIGPSIYKKLTYDPIKDFEAITMSSEGPQYLSVHPSLPVKSVSELVALAKSKPGKLNYGVSGIGETSHLNAELFKSLAGVDVMAVPFKGGSEAIKALMGGHIEMGFASISSTIGNLEAGTLRALAVTSAKRSPLTPDVPTFLELGFPEIGGTWYGILAPAGTPKTIITKLNTEIIKVLNMQDVQERMLKTGLEPRPMTPEEFTDYLKKDIVKWGKVIKIAGIQAQ